MTETTQAKSTPKKKTSKTPSKPPEEKLPPGTRKFEGTDVLNAIAEIREDIDRICLYSGTKKKIDWTHSVDELRSGLINVQTAKAQES